VVIKIYCPKCGIWNEINDSSDNINLTAYKCVSCAAIHSVKTIKPVTMQEVVSMVSQTQYIEAIKRLRTEFSWGLRESKVVVDAIKYTVNGKYCRVVED
jgi:ribosomal protein L7/L12